MDTKEVVEFINYLADDKTAVDLKGIAARSEARQFALSGAIDKLDKKTIREGMTFSITNSKGKEVKSIDERGQEYAIDTFAATKDGRGISKEDQARVQKAMELVVQFTNDALALKTPDGQPVFDPNSPTYIQDVMDEVFTPLVREGILPENLVRDKYSEVHRLLTNTIKNYKGTLEESRTDKLMKDSKIESGLAGSRGKLEKAKAIGGKLSQLKDRVVDSIGKENVENILFTKDLASLGFAAYKAEKNLEGWKGGMDSKNVLREDFLLHPDKALKLDDASGTEKYGADGWKYIKSTLGTEKDPSKMDNTVGEMNYGPDGWKAIKKYQTENVANGNLLDDEQGKKAYGDQWPKIKLYNDNAADPDYQRGVLENAKKMKRLDKTFGRFAELTGLKDDNETLAAIKKFLAKPTSDTIATAKFYTMTGGEMAKELTEAGIDIAKIAKELHSFDKDIKKILKEESADDLAKTAVDSIDTTFVAVLKKGVSADASDAIEGLFRSKLKPAILAKAIASDVNGAEFIHQIALAIEVMFSAFTPEVARVGKTIAKGVRGKTSGAKFNEAFELNPDKAISEMVDVVRSAVEDAQSELKQVFSNKETLRQIAAGALYGDEEAETNAVEELNESEDEMREFENMLVLMDQGGVSAAQQRSIEILVEEMQKDRKILELVNSIGNVLQGAGSGSIGIAGWATAEVTDVIVGEVVGPLKAAKLIMEFAISVKKASERWALWKAFQVDLERSKIAVSSLTSTIQGFYNNKKEQCAFRTVEQALMLVQIAGEILGSIPTPITLAIGKTISKVSGVAQKAAKIAEKRYDLAMMKKAWNKTREAIENPGNRQIGLKALRLNPSLGMHALAWAATELQPPDPIARMVLNSVGLNENTLAVSGSEGKVRNYLVTLLNEDRDLTDPTKFKFDAEFKTNWAPTLSLDTKCWAILTSRAERDASPKLQSGEQEKTVLQAFKAIGPFPTPDKLPVEGASEDLKPNLDCIKSLTQALKNYKPVSAGNVAHDEMENEAIQLLDLAFDRQEKVQAIYFGRQEKEAAIKEITALKEFLIILESEDDTEFRKFYDAEEYDYHLKRFKRLNQTPAYIELESMVEKTNERLSKFV